MTFNLRLIPLLPFLGATLLMLFGRKWTRDTVFIVAALAIGAAVHGRRSTRSSPRCPSAGAGGPARTSSDLDRRPAISRSTSRSAWTRCRP